MASAADQAQELRTTKSMRWINPFRRNFKTAPSAPVVRRVPDGIRVYCVGDIHGRDDLLGEMAERVAVDVGARSLEQTLTVFLGDYVDRGLGSMRVVEKLAGGEWPTPLVALAGKAHGRFGYLSGKSRASTA